jgi:hypothetical protein
LRQFDHSTITNAILHVRYIAREDSGPFKSGAIQNLRDYLTLDATTPSFRFFDLLRQEFPTEWYRFLSPINIANGNVLELEMYPRLFQLLDTGKTLKINSIALLARCSDDGAYQIVAAPPLPGGSNTMSIANGEPIRRFALRATGRVREGIEVTPNGQNTTWLLRMNRPGGAICSWNRSRRSWKCRISC